MICVSGGAVMWNYALNVWDLMPSESHLNCWTPS